MDLQREQAINCSHFVYSLKLKTHQQLDRAVMKVYGFPVQGFTEAGCVAALMGLYQEMIERGE